MWCVVGVCAALVVGTGNNSDVSIRSLLPAVPRLSGVSIKSGADARTHATHLRKAPEHGERFWVRGLHGSSKARTVVFVIPQYHRDDTMPVAWTTLGLEIADVQKNIDLLMRRLVHSHGLSCVGTEGSVVTSIKHSSELRQLAWWHHELTRGRDVLLVTLQGDAKRAQGPAGTLVRVLTDAIRQHAVYQDGVGAAQARLGGRALSRFGIEDASANQEALVLLKELRRVEQELAMLEPENDRVEVDVLGRMWLDEYPEYEKSTLLPLDHALSSLGALRVELRSDGILDGSRSVAAFTARARRIA
ncbi:hypothetical protein ACFL6C_14480, partial [Myxococcota bacterium]